METKQKFTIRKSNFLDFYFNSGADQDQESLALEIGQTVVENALKGEYNYHVDVQELFDNCGYIALRFCEEVNESHPCYDLEDTDLRDEGIEVEITLIDDVPTLDFKRLGLEIKFRREFDLGDLMAYINMGSITMERQGRAYIFDPINSIFDHTSDGGTSVVCELEHGADLQREFPDCKFDMTMTDFGIRQFDKAEMFLEFEDDAQEDYASDVESITLTYKIDSCTYAVDLEPETFTIIQ